MPNETAIAVSRTPQPVVTTDAKSNCIADRVVEGAEGDRQGSFPTHNDSDYSYRDSYRFDGGRWLW